MVTTYRDGHQSIFMVIAIVITRIRIMGWIWMDDHTHEEETYC